MSVNVTILGLLELRLWMRERGMTLKDFEQLSGIDRNLVWRLIHGQAANVSIGTADRIVKATDGAVTLDHIRSYEQKTQAFRALVREAGLSA